MLKHICDICGKKEADSHYKIKQQKDVCEFTEFGVFAKTEWVEIDICKFCMQAILAKAAKIEKSKPTNFDRIKSFNLDEMLDFLEAHTGCACCARGKEDVCPEDDGTCKQNIKKWLESEAE